MQSCGKATHHSRSEHHKAKPSSFAAGKHHSKKPNLSGRQIRLFCCFKRVKRSKKEKADAFYQKGIEHPLALLYNLITTKNPQESEIIMKFAHIRVSEYFTFAEQIFHSEAILLA